MCSHGAKRDMIDTVDRSIHSLVASPFKSAYVAAKHGLVGFSKVIALETCDTDITINTICPSYVKTPLVDAQIASQARVSDNRLLVKDSPLGLNVASCGRADPWHIGGGRDQQDHA
jgi:NAD(P)-dependent dehydrogenase (short-subunit alcohol dehydrogenase family)